MKSFIYGTGVFARDTYHCLLRHDFSVSGFLDHAPRQFEVCGLPVSPPDMPSIDERTDALVIIGIHNRDANIAAIIERLKTFGYRQIITPVDLYNDYAAELGARYWLAQKSIYADYQAQLTATAQLFADKSSRELFDAIINFRISGDYGLLPGPDRHHQYFPADLPAWKTPLRLMDCGAYDGDTLREISTLGISVEALAAYEPDESNFRKLIETVSQYKINNAALWPCGVYSTTTKLHFSSGMGEASLISAAGEIVVQCVSLDEAAPDFAPTLIKMDIEGAEVDALNGAEKIIAKYQPGLAICVYHTPQHLWEIPLLIYQLAQKYSIPYKYFLRTYAFNTFETVFYAIPSY